MVRIASFLVGLGAVVPASADEEARVPLWPSRDAAQVNAYRIFNTVHSAGRQWGSSIYHNGFSFFPAVMPEGTITYHGGPKPEPPTVPEWLAFEVEHAELFASSGLLRYWPRSPLVQQDESGRDDDEKIRRGYLHIYRANRDLNLLYVDGMSAGKTDMGTLDSQDFLLRENNTAGHGFMGERERAQDICDIISEWLYDGFIRTEVGFEVVYCDFKDGLDLLSSTRTYIWEDKIGQGVMGGFQWARAVAQRYDGLGGDRVRFDFSSMVSGFFFPINISSTRPDRPDLIRLGASTKQELKYIKEYLENIATQPRRFTVNWQAVVDMIMTRYADRLALMGSDEVSMPHFIDELETATLTYVNAPPLPGDIIFQYGNGHEDRNETDAAIDRCTQHYLLPALIQQPFWDLEDELIHTALRTVMQDVCYNLFSMRSEFLTVSESPSPGDYRINKNDESEGMRSIFELTRSMTQSLMERLGWSEWKKTRRCPVDELLFIAMWPFGSDEDHWNPGCRSVKDIAEGKGEYWRGRAEWYPPERPVIEDEL